MIAPLAILSVGATYVPLDNEYPKDRIEHMLSDTKAKMILTTEESHNECLRLKEQIKNFPKIINLSNFENIKVEDSYKGKEIEYEKVGLDHTACILYTSGSTGVPKGSPTSRLALLNLSEWYINYTNMTSDDIYGMYTAFVFDMHAMALWPTCVCGAALDVIPAEKRTNMNALASYINDHEITHTFITTQVAKIFAEGVKDSNLKVLFAAGEALRNVDKIGNYKMYDGYGPCENLALSTAINIDDRIDSTSVGWPFNNVKTYILDSNRRRVPVGAVGELYLSGHQLSSGYLNRDKETKAAFFDNPFDGKESGYKTMYKTGDIVRCLPDGSIGFVGRKDSQVKIRGNRVELTEVEDVIKKFDCIDNVTVQTVKNGNDNELVAYVVLTNNSRALDLASDKSAIFHKITQFVADKKPDYMVPSYVVVLDKIPLNVNGKVDKSALPKPNVESNRKEYTAPRNDIEKSLVEAFSHVLGVEKIGIDDNYFELGGNSIMTIELMSFPIFDESNILFQDIYDNPTPRLLAECMQGKTDSNKFIDRGISDYDYSSINSYLDDNYNESVEAYKNNSIDTSINPSGDIIITGATGFLGVHVLKEFLDNYNGKAYCVIRDRKNLTAKQRLNILFEFYFSCLPDEKYKGRIEVIDVDINSEVAQDKLSAIKADTVINCAACVDYVKNYEFMYKANVETVKNLIDLCLCSNKKLIHVSTISVYGYGNPDKANYKIAENKLYFGQVFDDSYTATKFIAERTILEAIIDKSLDAKIIRLGNLIGRYNDGALQINLASNGFLKTF